MRRRNLALAFAFILAVCHAPAFAAGTGEEDTDTLKVGAKVVEVNDHHISVIARTGVEHVIATDDAATVVKLKGKRVSLKDLRVGDVVTVELDEKKQVKFARNVTIAVRDGSTLASN
ncbi:MAG TPA: hypothetical protein VD968_02305 [Pyrinomonadaceae bacterium]|nr:hypothetical protein [Pyrinomonadaceae bacterium]